MRSTKLSGKIALVTGAGQNIGRSIALDLAESGATIIVMEEMTRASYWTPLKR